VQIGELSARTGASVRMLRYYEEQGLLEPRRTGSGYRTYAESDVDRVARICTSATLSGELAALTDKIAALQHSRDLLAQIVADVQGAVVGPGSPGEPGNAEDYTAVRKAGPAVGVVG